MRIIFLLLALMMLAVSCGKDGGSGNGLKQRQEQPDGIYDGLGVDLLDSMVDVNASVSGSSIVFLESKNSAAQGRRISCGTSVTKDEVYYFTVNGDSLYLQTNNGNFQMDRVNAGEGVIGTWKWVSPASELTRTMMTLTVLKTMSRVIIKTSCER